MFNGPMAAAATSYSSITVLTDINLVIELLFLLLLSLLLLLLLLFLAPSAVKIPRVKNKVKNGFWS